MNPIPAPNYDALMAFPQHGQPPDPKGIFVPDPKFHKPLFKMAKQMTKGPRRSISKPHHSRGLGRKKKQTTVKFY